MDVNNFKANKKIIDIKNGDKNIDIKVILIKFIRSDNLKKGNKITTYLVEDDSACIHCNLYDNVSNFIKEGDVI